MRKQVDACEAFIKPLFVYNSGTMAQCSLGRVRRMEEYSLVEERCLQYDVADEQMGTYACQAYSTNFDP